MVTALALEVGACAFDTSWVIPKTLEMVSVATLLGAQQALASLLQKQQPQ